MRGRDATFSRTSALAALEPGVIKEQEEASPLLSQALEAVYEEDWDASKSFHGAEPPVAGDRGPATQI